MILDKNLNTVQGATTHRGKEPLNAKKTEIRQQPTVKTPADVMREATDEIARRNRKTFLKASKAYSEAPAVSATTPKIEELKAQLTAALAEEDYEMAATLRDRIRALEAEEVITIRKPVKKKKEEA